MARPPRDADFFQLWSPAMAYVLGYWWADGYMRIHPTTKGHFIEIASVDRDHLVLMAETINFRYSIRKIKATSECCDIIFCSKAMYNDLLALGGMPNKSNVIGFPNVPAECLPHFVRGFVDGDGTLAWNGDRPVLQIYSGSHQLLLDMAKAIEQATGIPAPNIVANRALWYLKWSTIRAKCLAGWLYNEHSGLALARKAAIAQKFLQWQPKKRPEHGTITEMMRVNFSAYLPV
ncbi:MAG: hypothetical protein H0T53_05555 [Herpetosiphonaceae bacterium]|nr:hypothetical protein [Herpetosiphonaceae bacterium]